jgi:hypothetical protein
VDVAKRESLYGAMQVIHETRLLLPALQYSPCPCLSSSCGRCQLLTMREELLQKESSVELHDRVLCLHWH